MTEQKDIEAGKAIYERFTDKEQKDITQGWWVAGTMLVAGGLICVRFRSIGLIFLGVGVILLLMNWSAQKTMRRELAKVGDTDVFFAQLGGPDARVYSDFGLILTEDFVLREGRRTEIYPFNAMRKFEVGLAGNKLKKLFLTDQLGKRHEIAQTVSGDGRQEMFDEVYEYVRQRLPVRKP